MSQGMPTVNVLYGLRRLTGIPEKPYCCITSLSPSAQGGLADSYLSPALLNGVRQWCIYNMPTCEKGSFAQGSHAQW